MISLFFAAAEIGQSKVQFCKFPVKIAKELGYSLIADIYLERYIHLTFNEVCEL